MAIRKQNFVIPGPWGGVNELQSPRHIGLTELASSTNVVNRDGRITTRPGFDPTLDFNGPMTVVHKPIELIGAKPAGVMGIAWDTVNGKVYYSLPDLSEIRKSNFNGTSSSVWKSVEAYDIALDVGNFVYWIDVSTGEIQRDVWATSPGQETVTSDIVSASSRFALDAANSVIYHSHRSTGDIRKVDFSGGLPAAGVTLLTASVGPEDIWLSADGGTLYYVDGSRLYKTSTSTPAEVMVVDFALTFPDITDVRRVSGSNFDLWVYVVDFATEAVYRVDMPSGTIVQRVITTDVPFHPPLSSIPTDLSASGFDRWLFFGAIERMFYADISADSYSIVSGFEIQRNFKGVAPNELSRDIRLLQLLEPELNASELMVWFPTTQQYYRMNLGYQSGVELLQANRFVTNNRDAPAFASLGNGALSNKSGRHHYEPTGSLFENGRGGVVICDGNDGISDGNHQPFLFNYVLGDTIWKVVINGTFGTFLLSFDGQTTNSIGYNAEAFLVAANLQSLDSIDGIHVDKTTVGSEITYTIRIHGAWSGQNTPVLSVNGSGLTGPGAGASSTRIQVGGTDLDAFLYCVPVGLPKPVIGSGSGGVLGTITGTGLTGIYSWAVSWYSSRWRMESPPVEIGGNIGATTLWVLQNQGMSIAVQTAMPTTIYFDRTTVPFRHIDYLRIYRRRWGETHTNGIPDGVGATERWALVAQKYLPLDEQDGMTLSQVDNGLDEGVDDAPFENSYPPRNAQFSAFHQGRHFYGNAKDRLVWWSELSKTGLVTLGELGFPYVADSSFFDPLRATATDAATTALVSVADSLLIGTSTTPIRANTSTISSLGGPSLRPLEGVNGPASAWMIVRSDQRGPASQQTSFWIAANGYAYEFDGATQRRLSGNLKQTALATVRKYTHNPEDWTASNLKDSWYWNSMIVDPVENRILYSYFPTDAAGAGQAVQVAAMNLDNGAWTPGWTIPCPVWLVARSPSTGQPIVLCALNAIPSSGGTMVRLVDGADDAGSSFACSFATGNFALGDGTHPKSIAGGGLLLEFQRRSFGGANPPIDIIALLDGSAAATNPGAKALTTDYLGIPVQSGVRRLQLSLSWVHENLMTHPELISLASDFEFEGMRSQ